MDTTTIQPGDKIRTARGWFTVTRIADHGLYAYQGTDTELDELVRREYIVEHAPKVEALEPVTLPTWRLRLLKAHEHETIPTAKPGKKPLSSHAAAALMIRQTLKRVFPGVGFKVTSDSFAGGNSVDIHWTDGPTTAMVDRVAARFQYGHFDGSIDLYEYTNSRDDIPQAKYVQTNRAMSRGALVAIVDYLNSYWDEYALEVHPTENYVLPSSDKPRGNCSGWQSQDVWSMFSERSLICPGCDWRTQPTDNYCELCGTKLHEEDR